MIPENSHPMRQADIYGKVFTLQGDSQKYYCVDTMTTYGLMVQGVYYIPLVFEDRLPENWRNKSVWRFLPFNELYKIRLDDTLSGDYHPASNLEYAYTMNLITPDSMDKAVSEALRQLKQAVGNVTEFVAERLNYSLFELSEVLSNEQIDAVAMAIYNAEVRNQGMIIGDQTGVGKGRVAAALLRYAVEYRHLQPIFFTVKKDLFSDIIRDLTALHCHYSLFTTNSDGKVINDDGKIVLKYNAAEAKQAYSVKKIPADIMLSTYSQIPYEETDDAVKKRMFFESICRNNILVMDEAHKAGGDGFIANFFVDTIVPNASMVCYLSATFAKRPDNMPVYAVKTCIQDAFENKSNISEGIKKIFYYGGNSVEEIASSTLVEYGQMLRRERRNDDVDTSFITLDAEGAREYGVQNEVERHTILFNNISSMLKKLRLFEMRFIDPYIEYLNQKFKKQDKNDKTPLSDASYDKNKKASRTTQLTKRLFPIMNVAMFSLKAEAVGKRAVEYLKQGYKPVIGFASTLASILPTPDNKTIDESEILHDGDDLKDADLIGRFRNIFPSLMKYRVRHFGKEEHMKQYEKNKVQDPKFKIIEELELTPDILEEWWRNEGTDYSLSPKAEWESIDSAIKNTKLGIPISPIDVIKKIIEDANFSIAECTGRSYYVDYWDQTFTSGTLRKRQDNDNVTKKYNDFNDNIKDCLFLNSSASTGKSAHAIITKKVPREEVKKRVLIIAQAELDVNEEIQKRGRVNRTGQIYPPKIEYIFSFLPPERKLKAMLKRKLKSLSANTSANQEADAQSLEGEDIYNVFGDTVSFNVAKELWFDETSPSPTNMFMNNPLKLKYNKKKDEWEVHATSNGFAQTIFNCVQLLPIEEQEEFLGLFYSNYAIAIQTAKDEGLYFLETSRRDYKASLLNEYCIRKGDSEKSRFGSSAFLSIFSIRAQKKLPKYSEVGTLEDNLEIILNNIEYNYNQRLKDIETSSWENKADREENLNKKINSEKENIAKQNQLKNQFVTMLTDPSVKDTVVAQMKACDDKIKESEDKIKSFEEDIKNLDADIKENIKLKQEDTKASYEELVFLLKSLKVGSVYRFPDGNLYLVYMMKAVGADIAKEKPDEINYFSRPSDITIKMVSTDTSLASSISYNFADSAMTRYELLEIAKYDKLTSEDWDNYINSDKFRENVFMITGNIIPFINYDLKGTIVRFTLNDGTEDIGFQVKLERDEKTNRLKLPLRISGVAVPIIDYKEQIKKTIFNNNSRLDFIQDGIDGECYIKYERIDDNTVNMYLVYSASYKPWVNLPNPSYINGDWIYRIEDLDRFLQIMADDYFSVMIPFSLLDQYGIELGGEKYQMKDWKPLSYDKNKIPKQPKHYMHKLFVKLLK